MSRVYFHAKNRTAELRGSERAWLNHITQGFGMAAWDLDGSRTLERAAEIIALIPEPPPGKYGANYLHQYLREAQAENEANTSVYSTWKPGTPMPRGTSHDYQRRLTDALRTSLRVSDHRLVVAGVTLQSGNLDLNTALALGSDPVRLAAKIHGWSEVHAWIEGGDRAWLAGLIDDGLRSGIFRRGLWYLDGPSDGTPPSQHPDRKWSSQGWEEVQELLREADDGPVVMSYSVCDQFPNTATHPDAPYRDVESWDDYSGDEKRAIEDWRERWYEMHEQDPDGIFDSGMTWLRQRRPWARISPDTLSAVTFGPAVTIYDLFASDRDERVRRAAEAA